MRMLLNNIGKINEAVIEINGITIIAGENNTGKSTVSRALFSIFNSLYCIDKKIEIERVNSIENTLDHFIASSGSRTNRLIRAADTNEMAMKIVVNKEYNSNSKYELKSEIRELFLQLSERESDLEHLQISEIDDDTLNHIQEALNVDDAVLLEYILDKNLASEFNGQISNIYSDLPGRIRIEIIDQYFSVFLKNDSVVEVQNPFNMSLQTEAVYIDDPFVLDETQTLRLRYNQKYANHQNHLRRKLFASNPEKKSLVDELITKGRLEKINNKIATACSGDIVRMKGSSENGYRQKNSEKIFNMRNLSTGLKTFVILKMLLANGTIEEKGTIILDEPEIHLHPEWQLLFVEIIVLLQKEFNLHILINTHSPYFLRAIQVYSAKHNIAGRCKYYLSEMDGDSAKINDVSDCIDKIYAKLSHPLQRLENERWQDD